MSVDINNLSPNWGKIFYINVKQDTDIIKLIANIKLLLIGKEETYE
jgi:hypothetical protein